PRRVVGGVFASNLADPRFSLLACLLFVCSPHGHNVVERLDFFQKMAALLGAAFHLGFRPKLLFPAALGNHLVHVSLGVGPVVACFREQKKDAERPFSLIEAGVLQIGHALIPERLLLACRTFQLYAISLLTEWALQIGNEPIERTVQLGGGGEVGLRRFVVMLIRGFMGKVDQMTLLVLE